MLVMENDKLTLGQNLTLTAPHAMKMLLRGENGRWVSDAHVTNLTAAPVQSLNSAISILDDGLEVPLHDCEDCWTILRPVSWISRTLPYLRQVCLLTDGSSLVIRGVREAGASVTT